jgi:hypothetical protein
MANNFYLPHCAMQKNNMIGNKVKIGLTNPVIILLTVSKEALKYLLIYYTAKLSPQPQVRLALGLIK